MLDDIFTPREISSKEHLIQEIHNSLGDSLEHVIDSHNTASVIFVCKKQNKRYVLKAEFGIRTATHNEIRWYSNLPRNFRNIPQYLGSYIGPMYVLLLLEYIEGAFSLDDIALQGYRDMSAPLVNSILDSFNLDKQLFIQTRESVSPRYFWPATLPELREQGSTVEPAFRSPHDSALAAGVV